MATLRPPSAWADAQRAFHLAYGADPTAFERRPVRVTWMTRRGLGTGGAGLLAMAARAWRNGTLPQEGTEVTVTFLPEPARSLVFSIDPGPTPLRPSGETTGVLVGELGMNAVVCLEVDGRVIWPTTPPVERRAPQA